VSGPAPTLHIVGARPQFVKVAALLRASRWPDRHFIVHTGQHYDPGLSEVFFEELGIPAPHAHLGIGGGTHAEQTGAMLPAIESLLLGRPGSVVVVYGDTNSTLAGALAAAKTHVPLVHVEAGLRSFDRRMPEEINRIVTDHVSDHLLCPTPAAVAQLASEGLTRGVHWVGDVMLDIARAEAERSRATPLGRLLEGDDAARPLPEGLGASLREGYVLVTIHRAANTDEPETLTRLVGALGGLGRVVVWPVHPRTRGAMARLGLALPPSVVAIDPLGYLAFSALLRHADLVLTDSGGVQKEAWFAGRRCVTLRDTTEWTETLADGWNTLVGDDVEALVAAVRAPEPTSPPDLGAYGDGRAAERCMGIIEGLTAP
jgi:UDP-GlcNAc3NAcA epimerase